MAFKLKRSLLLPLLLFTSAVSCATLALFVASEQKNDQFISDGDTESAPRDLWTITEIIFGTGAGMFVLWPLISLWTIFKHIPGAAWTALNILWGIGTLVLLVGGIGLMIAELASKQNQGEWWALLFTGLAGFLMTLFELPLIAGFARRKRRGTSMTKGQAAPLPTTRPGFAAYPATATATA